MSGIEVVTEAQDFPVSLSEAKNYLRLDDQVDDNFVKQFVVAATQFAENFTNKAFIKRTLRFSVYGASEVDTPLWEGMRTAPYVTHYRNYIELPVAPAIAVQDIKYYNNEDIQTTWPSTAYYVDTVREPARVVLRDGQSFPTNLRKANGIEITYTAGYGDFATDVPESIRVAVLQYIAFLYEHRGEFERFPPPKPPVIIQTLLQPYTTLRFSTTPYMPQYRTGIR